MPVKEVPMDVQAYRVAVRLALDDQITRNLLQVSRDAIELNKKFVTITKNIKALTSAAREATSALQALNRSLNNEFSGASRGAREYAGAIREIADQTQRINRVPLLASGYGAAMTLPVLAAGAAASGGSGGYGNPGGRLALPAPSGRGGCWHGWNNGVPPGGWGGGGAGHGGGHGHSPAGSSFSDGMTNLTTGYLGFRMLKGFVDEAARYQTMTEKFRQFGMDQAATDEALRFAETTRVRGSSATDMLKYLVEAQGVFSESGAKTLGEQLRAAKLAASRCLRH